MKYIDFVNQTIKNQVSKEDKIILFGQNVDAGSCISGLSRGMDVMDGSKILNTPNSENTLVGAGFGLMLNGVNSIFFMKQLDFLFLGIDQLTNSYNYIRTIQPKASFTIIPVIVDSGYEGMMASTNNLSDFCAISRISGYTITNHVDTKSILDKHLIAPGLRIIALSQRLWKEPLLLENDQSAGLVEDGLFQYETGDDVTIVCFNFSFPQAHELSSKMKAKGISPSLFSVNRAMSGSYSAIIQDVQKTKKIVVIDDSKTNNKLHYEMLTEVYETGQPDYVEKVTRFMTDEDYAPNADLFEVNNEKIIDDLLNLKG
jgi:pyruvate/2-oxoglutarate/acetoin dehydrogenase E1 component